VCVCGSGSGASVSLKVYNPSSDRRASEEWRCVGRRLYMEVVDAVL